MILVLKKVKDIRLFQKKGQQKSLSVTMFWVRPLPNHFEKLTPVGTRWQGRRNYVQIEGGRKQDPMQGCCNEVLSMGTDSAAILILISNSFSKFVFLISHRIWVTISKVLENRKNWYVLRKFR